MRLNVRKFYEWEYYTRNPLLMVNFIEPNYNHVKRIKEIFCELDGNFIRSYDEASNVTGIFSKKIVFYCQDNLEDKHTHRLYIIIATIIKLVCDGAQESEVNVIIDKLLEEQISFSGYNIVNNGEAIEEKLQKIENCSLM